MDDDFRVGWTRRRGLSGVVGALSQRTTSSQKRALVKPGPADAVADTDAVAEGELLKFPWVLRRVS